MTYIKAICGCAFAVFLSTLGAHAATLVGPVDDASGIDDLVVSGVSYDLEFVYANGGSINDAFGTGALPQFDLGQTLGEDMLDAIAAFEAANPFSTFALGINAALLLLPYGSDASSIDYGTFRPDQDGIFGPFTNSRTVNFTEAVSFVVATRNGPVSTVPLPAALPLLLAGLGGLGIAGRRRKG